jgi:hypothetical protein
MPQTLLIPLSGSPTVSPKLAGVVVSSDPDKHLTEVVQTIRNASKVIIICGMLK